MSAETLRRAAAQIRKRAEAATPGPLDVMHWREGGKTTHHTLCKHETRTVNGVERGGFLVRQVAMTYADAQGHADFAHIASWHPAVALAVADWLDTAGADLWAHGPLCCEDGCMECDGILWMQHVRRALAVARAYLGGDDSA